MKEVEHLERQYHRVIDKLDETDPGSKEFGDLLDKANKLFTKLQENEKAVIEQELKESEFQLKADEVNKPWFKRVEVWLQLIGASLSFSELLAVLLHEDRGNVITTKAFNLMHRLRLK